MPQDWNYLNPSGEIKAPGGGGMEVELPPYDEWVALPIEKQREIYRNHKQGGAANAFISAYLQNVSEVGGKTAFLNEDDPAADKIKAYQEAHPLATTAGRLAGTLTNPLTLAGMVTGAGTSAVMKPLNTIGKLLVGAGIGGAEEAVKSGDITRTLFGMAGGSLYGAMSGNAIEKLGSFDKLIRKLNVKGTIQTDPKKAAAMRKFYESVTNVSDRKLLEAGKPSLLPARPQTRKVVPITGKGRLLPGEIPSRTAKPGETIIRGGNEANIPSREAIYDKLMEVIDEEGRKLLVSPSGTSYVKK